MSTPAASKICAICKQDCSNRPRIKDSKGRYFCKACHEAALHESSLLAPASSTISPAMDSADIGFLDSVAGTASVQSTSCQACGAVVSSTSVLCTTCGHRLDGRGDIRTRVVNTPNSVQSGGKWATTLGWSSIGVGVFWLIMIVISIAGQFKAAQSEQPFVGAGVGCFPIPMYVWLIIAGDRVRTRRSGAVRNLRMWSIVRIVLSAVCGGGAAIMVFALSGVLASDPELRAEMPFEPALLGVILLGSMILEICWPIIVLVWTAQPALKAEADTW